MRRLYAGTLIFIVCWTLLFMPVMAHDIGVSQAALIEQQGQRYELSVQTGPAIAYIFATPRLPDHCEFIGNPSGTQGTARKTFVFDCANGLTAAHTIELPWRRDGIMLTARWLDGSEAKQLFASEAGRISVPLVELQAGSGSWLNAAKRYTVLGIEHILTGFDHLLFVLCLVLIVAGGWRLVKTITAFTLAHSITLALATLGLVNVSSAPVEASIALSIAFLAAEILRHRGDRDTGLTYRYPWLIAFAFGLLHGLGFAGALATIGLPQSEIPIALLFFNIGVEIGQLAFVAVVLLALDLLRRLRLPSSAWIELAPAYTIGIIATWWLFERISGMVMSICCWYAD